MPDTSPLISIITVCRNAAAEVARTIVSVDAQTFTDYEHIVLDGASTDGTQAVVESFVSPRRTLVSEPDSGIYDAMNKGICAAKGTYLIFLNAGDTFHSSDSLDTVARAIAEGGTPGIVYGQTDIVDAGGHRLGSRHLKAPDDLTLQSFADGMVVCHQAFVVLKRIVGFYNLKYRYSADYEWCIRCLQHSRHNVGLGDTVLIDYLNEGVTTRNHTASLIERFRIMAYYYGTLNTVKAHMRFVKRWWKRRNDRH